MTRFALIFPGQGAQYVGMAADLAREYPVVRQTFEEASDALGFDLARMCFEGPESDLQLTENTQPAILTHSVAALRLLASRGAPSPAAAAGLSLGEYSALVAAGSFDFFDAVRLVRERGRYMQEAVPEGVGTMAAILGLDRPDVESCCAGASGGGEIVEPANYNCPGQTVIAGHVPAVHRAVERCKAAGAKKAVVLPVSAPFHCSLLRPAGERLAAALVELPPRDAGLPVVANVDAEYVRDSDDIVSALVAQVSSPVLWEDCVRRMVNDGCDCFLEVGPGKALSGFVKRIAREAKCLNVDGLDSLGHALRELEGVC